MTPARTSNNGSSGGAPAPPELSARATSAKLADLTTTLADSMYVLLDANVTAAYYLRRSTTSTRVANRIEIIFDSVRSGERKHFFYLPNFCVAEVFSVFMKYCFGSWNRHVKGETIDTRHYNRIVKQFESDIHNGKFIYHYELARYHVLGINLVAPVDHYFRISRDRRGKDGKVRKRPVNPMSTLDHLIISMGIHLGHIHGVENVAIVSADDRLTNILAKCKTKIPPATIRMLKLDKCGELTGREFKPDIFPKHVNLRTASESNLRAVLGEWPLPVGSVPAVGRYLS
jgi:hypothetical protein